MLNKNDELIAMHVALFILNMTIYLVQKTQKALLITKKIIVLINMPILLMYFQNN